MKKWLIDTFLPMWAKETVLSDNRAMRRRIKALEQENEVLSSYIRGLEKGMRAGRRTDCHVVEAQDTMLHFPQAENSGCILASPLPTKAIRLCGDPFSLRSQ